MTERDAPAEAGPVQDELLRRVAAHARAQRPAPGADPQAVAEAALGFALPELLRWLYTEVGNGGFGPDYRLLPLVGAGRTAVGAYLAEFGQDGDDEPSEHWPRGLLPVLDWGCAMYAAVDCLDPAAPVLLFEPNAGPDDWAEAWFEDAPSLAAWLEAWVSGTGWWEEEVMMADETARLEPWPDAARRLRPGAQD